MRLHQILDSVEIILNNRERAFVESHQDIIHLNGLDESDSFLVQGLVRKGVYKTSRCGSKIKLKQGKSE
jgi:hypothetical protein